MSTVRPETIQDRLSPERFAPYVAEMGDLKGALLLYEWNMAASAAFFETICILEVVLRNRFHECLQGKHVASGKPGEWYHDVTVFDQKGQDDIANARQRSIRKTPIEIPGKVIAELQFGFWRFAVAKRYQATLWPTLRFAFLHHPSAPFAPRADVDIAMASVNKLRNRIAHHERIFDRNLPGDHTTTLELLEWICPDSREWAASLSRVPAVLALRPTL